jgi:predicted transcriptional regulator
LQESNIESMKEELALAKPSLERRFIPRVCVVMIITEKIVGFTLPRLDGKMDYQVFAGNDPESLRWAGDLFEDQWNKGRPWHP